MNFEQAFSDTERAADSALKAAGAVNNQAREPAKAAKTGNITGVRRERANLKLAMIQYVFPVQITAREGDETRVSVFNTAISGKQRLHINLRHDRRQNRRHAPIVRRDSPNRPHRSSFVKAAARPRSPRRFDACPRLNSIRTRCGYASHSMHSSREAVKRRPPPLGGIPAFAGMTDGGGKRGE